MCWNSASGQRSAIPLNTLSMGFIWMTFPVRIGKDLETRNFFQTIKCSANERSTIRWECSQRRKKQHADVIILLDLGGVIIISLSTKKDLERLLMTERGGRPPSD